MCRVITESQNSFVTVAPADVAVTCNPTGCAQALGNTVAVSVTGHFQLVTPLLSVFTGGTNVTIASTATAQLFVPPEHRRRAHPHADANADARANPHADTRANPHGDADSLADADAPLLPAFG